MPQDRAATGATSSRRGVQDAAAARGNAAGAPPAPARRARRTALALVALAVATLAVSYALPEPALRPHRRLHRQGQRPHRRLRQHDGRRGLRRDAPAGHGRAAGTEPVRERLLGRAGPGDAPLHGPAAHEPRDAGPRPRGRPAAGSQGAADGLDLGLGRHYVISLEAVNAATGETIVREQVEAESREKVLGRLGEAAASLREKLGESIGSIEKFAAPIEQATTPSLEAFKAYDLGRQRHFSGQYFEAIPLYRRAVELDPELRHRLCRARHHLRHRAGVRPGRAGLAARLRPPGAGERAREVLHLGALLHGRARRRRPGHRDAGAVETDLPPRFRSTDEPGRPLRRDRTIRTGPRGGARGPPPESGRRGGLRQRGAQLHLSRPVPGGQGRLEQALARKLEPPYSRYMLYGIALLEGDAAAMQQQVDRVAGTPTEAGMLAHAVGDGRVRGPGAPGAGADEDGPSTSPCIAASRKAPASIRRATRSGRRPTAIAAARSRPPRARWP